MTMTEVAWDSNVVPISSMAEVNRPLGGMLSWVEGRRHGPSHPLPGDWPRCVACDLTNDRDIIPALVVSPRGVALCSEHAATSGFGGADSCSPHAHLHPPCAECGRTVCGPAAFAKQTIFQPDGLVVGFLCHDCGDCPACSLPNDPCRGERCSCERGHVR